MRRRRRSFFAYLLAALVLSSAAPALSFAQSATAHDGAQWFVGGYYRHSWVPKLMLSPFFERAAGVSNDGLGISASRQSRGGATVELGLGYMPYHFKGPFNLQGAPVEDTEYITSSLAMVHVTGAMRWPVQLYRSLTLEIGVGVDFGLVVGSMRRSEAYPDANGSFRPCDSALHPATTGPDADADGARIPYCNQAVDIKGNKIASNPHNVSGAHYNVTESRVPPVMLIPMLPQLALRFVPWERVAVKLEAAYGLAQFSMGVSVQVGLDSHHAETPARVVAPKAELAAPSFALGRVLGKLMEQASDRPIARASVKTQRVFSAIVSDEHGLFVFDKLEPGPVHLEITHPDYEAASCDTTIPAQGGDAVVHCFLRPQPREGAISGQIKDEHGTPVAGARVEVTGPTPTVIVSDAGGLFAVTDAAPGTYRLRVEAKGFLMQLLEIEVQARDTAMPQIILSKAGKVALVTRTANQLTLKQQIVFEQGRADIVASSDGLLREIADALLRNRDIALIEIQGHTDSSGGREKNLALSQARAEAVRAWLVAHGVEAARLQARGYGPDQPLRDNDTAEHAAQNRRVQFMVLPATP